MNNLSDRSHTQSQIDDAITSVEQVADDLRGLREETQERSTDIEESLHRVETKLDTVCDLLASLQLSTPPTGSHYDSRETTLATHTQLEKGDKVIVLNPNYKAGQGRHAEFIRYSTCNNGEIKCYIKFDSNEKTSWRISKNLVKKD